MRRCGVCGGESGDRSQYCFQCGAPLAPADAGGAAGLSSSSAGALGAAAPAAAAKPEPTVPEQPSHVPSVPPPPGASATTPEDRPSGRQRIETAPTAAVAPGQLAPIGSAVAPSPLPVRVAPVPSPMPPAVSPGYAPAAYPAAALAPAPGEVGPGTVIDGKYTVARVLGEGGMGVVYLARDNHTGIDVVLKSVRPEVAHRPDTRARMLSEGQALARIDHPNVVQLKAVVEQGPALWLVMQYVAGESLEQTIARYGERGAFMPVGEVVRAYRQIVAGVGAAHGEGLIHRDLKPANILIRAKDGVVKVTDFGIAKVEEDAIAGRGLTRGYLGSPHYTSPEQVMGRPDLDRRVDIYALGILLFEMLTNRVPFDAESAFEVMRMHADTALPRVSSLRPELPAALDDVIRRACAKNRDQRFASVDELLAAVLAALPATAVPVTLDEGPGADARLPQPTAPAFPAQAPPGAWPVTGQMAAAPGYGYQAPAGTITGQSAALPPSGGGSSWGWVVAIGGFCLLLVGIGALALAGVFSPASDAGSISGGEPSQVTTEPTATAAPTPAPSFNASDPTAGLDALVGRWSSDNGRTLEAVRVGDELEFRVLDASQFSAQDYRLGEPRFVLRALPEKSTEFAVEDRVRPLLPPGYSYDAAQARNTCLAVRTEAGDKPLRAVVEGDRLTVDFAKIGPEMSNFVVQGNRITGCRRLESLRARRAPMVVIRER